MRGLLLAGALVCFGCRGRDQKRATAIGKPVPEVILPDLDGKMVRLSDFRGNVVVVNFWATWCPPCVEEMPSLEKLQNKLGRSGLEVVAISVDDDLEAIRQFQENFGLSFTLLQDEGAKVSHAFGTYKYPETYVLDREGSLAWKIVGPREWTSPQVLVNLTHLLGAAMSSES
ncbi:MAG: TlpA family protein disulfide reductase [Acidobacteriota bacterium]